MSDVETPQPPAPKPLSISELTHYIKDCLQHEFASVWVAGEIVDLARPRSGHIYLTLKDKDAQLRAIIWRSAAARLKFPIEDGMEVLCQGAIDIYPQRGTYQLIVKKVELRGEGAAQQALKRLREKLRQEGLFDEGRKRPLPLFPKRIAVVTSPTGAAIRDFLETARQRWESSHVTVIPARVQGFEAADEITRGIRLANKLADSFDILVVTRGGGSMEDLQSFNNEAVCRAIAASELPVISAVGHEIDVTLADLVADVRGLTPTHAAELAVPPAAEIKAGLHVMRRRLIGMLRARFEHAQVQLERLSTSRVLKQPEARLLELSCRLDELQHRTDNAIGRNLQAAEQRLSRFAAQLESLSPLAVLARGYSITQSSGTVVTRTDQVKVGDELTSRLSQGRVVSRVESVVPESE